jgi:hypothetical protein
VRSSLKHIITPDSLLVSVSCGAYRLSPSVSQIDTQRKGGGKCCGDDLR